MIEAFVGLVGGGKSFGATRRMCEYVIRGGVVCTNILFRGYDPETASFSPDSPFLVYLLSRQWQYQPGQYIYIPFDDMLEQETWFQRVPGGSDRTKRTLLCIDEATDLFDTLDRNKLSTNSGYRELFRFLRLSRHAHIDVLFICQDYFSINSRLRGLCGAIWKSTDMQNFRLPTFHIPLPINCFLLQKFDRTGRLELFREFIAKDQRIFNIYESETFHDALGISFSGQVGDGRVKGRKMTKFQKFVLFLCLLLSVIAVVQLLSLSRKVEKLSAMRNDLIEKKKDVVQEENETFPPPPVVSENPDRFIRGDYVYSYLGTRPRLYFDDCLIEVGMITEYGKCISISPVSALCVDGPSRTFLLPSRRSGGPPKTTAFAPPETAEGQSAL